ncbi:MAG: hypothetical protein IJG56_04760 [Clostridia bacterium]|jgi:hypothetical protein|nr:hypothetical protein [Clostridia bacterium]MBQ6000828.1 hypothetical protein [Clostridia bacterium]
MELNTLLKIGQAWSAFQRRHPQAPALIKTLAHREIPVGTEVRVSVTFPDGEIAKAGVRIKPEDLELIRLLK